jgi:hypothetical protein
VLIVAAAGSWRWLFGAEHLIHQAGLEETHFVVHTLGRPLTARRPGAD